MNAIASGFCADINHRVADPARACKEKFLAASDAEGECIHQWIIGVTGFELHFAADVGHAKAVAIEPNPAHHAIENPPILLNLFWHRGSKCSARLQPGMLVSTRLPR